MEYSNIKIPQNIIIVEKPLFSTLYGENAINQGYVVLNEGMYKTAIDWAHLHYHKDGKNIIIEEEHKKYIHTYENGSFTLVLDEPAYESSQGGKVSFSNCIILDSENNSFKIGINSELLHNLLKATTFVKGVCASKVWLGRANGNYVGAFTEDMEEFTEAKKIEQEQLELKVGKTTLYVPGDVIKTTTSTEIYAGEFYCHALVFKDRNSWHGKNIYIALPKPVKMYGYIDSFRYDEYGNTKDVHLHERSAVELRLTKSAKTKTGVSFPKVVEEARNMIDTLLSNGQKLSTSEIKDDNYFYPMDKFIVINSNQDETPAETFTNFKLIQTYFPYIRNYSYFNSIEEFKNEYPERKDPKVEGLRYSNYIPYLAD